MDPVPRSRSGYRDLRGAGGPRLPFGVTLLAFVLVFPSAIGPVVSGFAEDSLG
jgi:hypothetical protein